MSCVYQGVEGLLPLDGRQLCDVGSLTEERLEGLFDLHHRRLFRLALRICRDREEARDLVQETFVRAARHVRSLPEEDRGSEGWLVRTLVNLCRDRGRRLAVRRRDDRSASTASWTNSEGSTLARLTVRAALRTLSPIRRALVALVELEGHTAREAAALLGIQPATVRWHLFRARKQLSRSIEQTPGGAGEDASEGSAR